MDRNKTGEDQIVLCREYSSDIDARLAQEQLGENGIVSILDNETFSSVFPIGFNSIGGIRLMVYARDLEKALRIINREGE